MSTEYTISVSNSFEAESKEDAIVQFALWIEDYARSTGYRVEFWDEMDGDAPFLRSELIDAGNLDVDHWEAIFP